MIGFYHGTGSLPAKENLKSGIYFIVGEGNKGKLYRVLADGTDGVLIAETNNDTEFASLKAAVEQAQKDIVKNAGDVATILAGLTKITEKHGTELENITTEAASIRELAQGAANQAALNKAAHEKNAGDIKTNTNAISAMKADAKIVTFKGVEEALAGKEAVGEAAKAEAAAKLYAEQQAGAVDAAYKAKIGDIAEGTTVKKYIDDAVEGVVDSDEFNALEQDVATIKGDYLKAADKTALEGKINAKADQTALDAVSAVANAAVKQSDYDTKVAALEAEDQRIAGLVATEKSRAEGVEAGLDERLVEVEAFFKTTDGETIDSALDRLVEIQEYLEGEGSAVDGALENIAANAKAIEDMDKAYKAADETLQGEIDALEGRMDTAEADIDALKAKFSGSGDGTVAKMIADAVATEAGLRETGVNEAKAAAKAADDKAVAAQGEVDALETVVAGKAAQSDLEALQGRVKTVEDEITTASTGLKARMTAAEGEIDALQAELDTPSTGIKDKLAAVETQASNNKAAIESNDSDIAALMAALEWKQA